MLTDALEGDHKRRLQLLLLIHLYARADTNTLRTIRATVCAMCPNAKPRRSPAAMLAASALAAVGVAVPRSPHSNPLLNPLVNPLVNNPLLNPLQSPHPQIRQLWVSPGQLNRRAL
eukprot:8999614-Pyramimonas_sp.AAC.1